MSAEQGMSYIQDDVHLTHLIHEEGKCSTQYTVLHAKDKGLCHWAEMTYK